MDNGLLHPSDSHPCMLPSCYALLIKIGYDLGVGTGTYGGYVRWVRTLVRVRYGGTVRGWVRYGGTVWGVQYGGTVRCVRYGGTVRGYAVPVQCTHRTCFQEMWYTVPVRRTPVPYPSTVPPYRTPVPYPRTVPPYRTRTRSTYLPTYRTRTQKHVPASRTVPKPPRYVHRTPP